MSQYKLDKWDCQLIRDFKRSMSQKPTTIESLKAIWAERCALDVQYIRIRDINRHLLSIVYKLNLLDSDWTFQQFILNLNPSKNWGFVCQSNHYSKDETDYDLILLSRLDSLLSLTEVSKLNGYKEYIESLGVEI